ncbi:MAG: MEKHLA domain-containing protein, partial [Planctomycetaceae bacterium]
RVLAPLSTWSIYVITSNRGFEQQFGRRAHRRRKLFNGKLECQFYQYPGPPPKRGDQTPTSVSNAALNEYDDASSDDAGSAELDNSRAEDFAVVGETTAAAESSAHREAEAAAAAEAAFNANPWLAPQWLLHTQVLLDSFQKYLGRELITRSDDPEDEARRLFEAPFVVVSHGTQDDPVLNYGNRAALSLWEMDAATLTSMPSRLTAEPMHRDERAEMMARALRDGYVDDYQGIRISSSGKRFHISQAIIWNLVNLSGQRVGQAATFSRWTPVESPASGT